MTSCAMIFIYMYTYMYAYNSLTYIIHTSATADNTSTRTVATVHAIHLLKNF